MPAAASSARDQIGVTKGRAGVCSGSQIPRDSATYGTCFVKVIMPQSVHSHFKHSVERLDRNGEIATTWPASGLTSGETLAKGADTVAPGDQDR